MGKYQAKSLSANKARQFEPRVVQTRRGPQLQDRAVASPQSPSSRNSSPSKKRQFSPGILDPDHDNDGHDQSFQLPKRSRKSGKVFKLLGNVPLTVLTTF